MAKLKGAYLKSRIYRSLLIGNLMNDMIVISMFLFFLAVTVAMLLLEHYEQNPKCFYFVGLFAFFALGLTPELYKRFRERRQKMLELQKTDLQTFLELDKEVRDTKKRYGCIYLLNDYLYIPSAQLLTRYEYFDEIWIEKRIVSPSDIPIGYFLFVYATTRQGKTHQTLVSAFHRKKLQNEINDLKQELEYRKIQQCQKFT